MIPATPTMIQAFLILLFEISFRRNKSQYLHRLSIMFHFNFMERETAKTIKYNGQPHGL